MASVLISGDTSGAITISAPAVSGTNTLTLPVATDTLVGKATTDTLTNKSIVATQLTGTVAAARLPAGSVLQVVQFGTGTSFSTTSGAPVTTGFTQSITPSSASSKILVIATSSLGVPTSGMNGSVLLYRDSTQITTPSAPSAVTFGAAAFNQNQFTAIYLDSPATTSSTAYAMYAYRDGAAGTFYVGARYDGGSPMLTTITLMEIAG